MTRKQDKKGGRVVEMERVDETIVLVCDWIQLELKNICGVQEESIMPEMIKALADLIMARAQYRV